MIPLIAINLQALELMAAIKFRTVSSHLGKEETYCPIDAPQIGRDATADRAELLCGWHLVFKALLATVAPLLFPPRSQGRKNKDPLEGIDARLFRSSAVIDLNQ